MPGLRKDVDTSGWGESDWRNAQNKNLAFLVGWLMFFSVAILSNLSPVNWFVLAPMLSIAVIGVAIQIVWLHRISILLDN